MKGRIGAFIALALSITLLAPAGLWAAESFLFRFEQELQKHGYTDAEQALFMNAARERNWDSVGPEFAEMAGFSLAVCTRARTETQARAQLELVYQLGVMNGEMKALGFTEREIARIALGASRETAEALRTRTNADNTAGNGELIRDRIREELCAAGLQSQEAKIMERIRARIQSGAPDHGRGSPR